MRELFENALGFLRFTQFMPGANLEAIENERLIRNPYAPHHLDDNEFSQGADMTKPCLQCEQQYLFIDTTTENREEMYKEAHLKLLKVKRAFYRHENKSGVISNESAGILVDAANDAMHKRDVSVDVDKLVATWELKSCIMYLRNILAVLNGKQLTAQPTEQRLKKFVKKILTSKIFHKVILLVVISNAVQIVMQIYLQPPPESAKAILFVAVNTFSVVLYSLEFFFKTYSFGFFEFLKNLWNVVDMLIAMILAVHVIIYYYSNFVEPSNERIATVAQVFMMLSLLQLLKLVRGVTSALFMLVDNYVNKHLCQAFELGSSFIRGEEEVKLLLQQMVHKREVVTRIKEKIVDNVTAMKKRLGALVRENPTLEITVLTRQGIATGLQHLMQVIESHHKQGLLTEIEFSKQMKSCEMKMLHLNTHFKMQAMADFPTLLRKVPLIGGNEELANAVQVRGEFRKFQHAETILEPGPTDKFCIILSGTVKILYEPSEAIINNQKKFGALPNIDYFSSLDFSEPQEHTISCGSVIGEMALLTSGIYNATAVCDGPVEVLVVPKEVLEITLEVEERIWTLISRRIMPLILQSLPAYTFLYQNTLRSYQAYGFVQLLHRIVTFRVNRMVKYVLLINGTARDETSGAIFVGPTCIPRIVRKLEIHIPSSPDMTAPLPTILSVIPEQEFRKDDVLRQTSDLTVRSSHSSHSIGELGGVQGYSSQDLRFRYPAARM